MKKYYLKRVFAAFVASVSVLSFASFAACDTGNGTGDGTGNNGGITDGGGSDTGGDTGDNGNTGGSGNTGGGGFEKPEEPVIPTYPAGSVQITESKGDQESAYVIWNKVDGAMGYNVYYKNEAGGDYIKLDAPLVREYKNYCRADAVGLKAGTYTLKVVPTGGAELAEDGDKASEVTGREVVAHERTGYAFVDGTASGAYNEDGTLKANANVLYITDANKDTVTLNGATGLQNILNAQKKAGKPLAVRLIGNIASPDVSTSTEKVAQNVLLIKGNNDKSVDMQTTLEGVGNDATANGWTLRVTSATNVEIRNIAFMNTHASEPDDVTLEKDKHIWVHNCDLFYGGAGGDSDQAKGDGALDTKESTFITHSYNHFWDSGKCNLQNMHESGDWRITYHHNWYDHSDSRHPRVRSATVHVYNNYFDGNAKYGVGACEGSSIFVENNYFRSTATMKPMLSSMQGTDAKGVGTFSGEDGGMIKAYGNAFDGKYSLITQNSTSDKTDIDCYLAASRDENVPADYKTKQGGTTYNNFDTASDFYEYTADSPEVAKEKVELYAGRVGGGDFKWEFNDATEDSNYSIIAALKTALTGYKSDLVKVGGEAANGDNTSDGGTGEGGGSTGGETGGTLPGDVNKVEFISDNAGKYPAGITVSGNYSSNTGYLKMESATKVTVKVEKDAVITVHTSGASGKGIKLNGAKTTLDGNGECSITIKADGTLTIEKGDSMELMYIIIN